MNSNADKEKGREKDRQMDEKIHNDFYSPEGKARRKKGIRRFFAITLLLTVFMSLVNWGVITGWGSVKIQRLTISGSDGIQLSALIYIPQNASNETPAPLLICHHGNAGNARNHESWSLEFARRGFVVLSVDQFGAGNSQNYTADTLGLDSMTSVGDMFYQYVLSMPIVDHNNIIAADHSMGCSAAAAIGAMHNAKAIISASPVILLGEDNKYLDAWNAYTGNYLDITGLVESSVEAKTKESLAWLSARPGFENQTEFKLDTVYGSFEEGNAFCAKLETHRIHEAAFVNSTSIGNILWFSQMSVGEENVPNYIDAGDQIWPIKDYTGLFGMYAFAAFLCMLALLLIEEIPAFEIVKQPLPRNIGLRGVGFLISAALGIIFPYIVLKTDAFGIIGGRHGAGLAKAGFQLTYANMAFGTVIGLNMLGCLGFLLYYFAEGRRHKLGLRDLGLTNDGNTMFNGIMILKTMLVSAIVIAVGWTYVKLQGEVLGTDFYGWFFGIKDIPMIKLKYYVPYIIVWIICFIVASFTLNVERRLPTTGKEWLDTLIAIVVNIVLATFTIVVIIVVKWELQSVGRDTYAFWTFGADTQRIWGMPVGMSIGIGGSTFLFRKTGNTWLSAILMGIVASIMCVTFGQLRIHF
jgi:pimeloyl-ACP methyl ester carboxylesterase